MCSGAETAVLAFFKMLGETGAKFAWCPQGMLGGEAKPGRMGDGKAI